MTPKSNIPVLMLNIRWILCSLVCFLPAEMLAKDAAKATPIANPKPAIVGNSSYGNLLKSLNIYETPIGTKKIISIQELFQRVRVRGIALKVAKESLKTAQSLQNNYRRRKLPVLSLDLGHNQSWYKTESDSDTTDFFVARDQLTGSRKINSTAGLSLKGNPLNGLSYQLQFPQLEGKYGQPESVTTPPRHDSGGYSASLELSLLSESPFFVEPIQQKKKKLDWDIARETFKSETLKALSAAEKSFYVLIQKHLTLRVQERALGLAKALESDVKEKITAGESSELEAMRANLQTSQTETELMGSQIDFEDAVEEFRKSLSYDQDESMGIFPDPKSKHHLS